MTGKGPAGVQLGLEMPDIVAMKPGKCPDSPGKRKYTTMRDAREAADRSASQYGKEMEAYVCPGCGYYHVTSKFKGLDVVKVRNDGHVVTRALDHQELLRYPAKKLPERQDMSEVLAMELPIVPANFAAREKVMREYITQTGATKFSITEVEELISAGRQPARDVMKALGWTGKRGPYGGWFSPDYTPPTDEQKDQPTAKGGPAVLKKRSHKKKPKKPVVDVRALRVQALHAFLADKDAVRTLDIAESLSISEYAARELIRAEGWEFSAGNRRLWARPGATRDAIAAAAPEPKPSKWEVAAQEVMAKHAAAEITADAPAAAERDNPDEFNAIVMPPIPSPIDLASRRQPPAEPAEPERIWRTLEINDKLMAMTLAQVCDTIEAFGMELSIRTR